MGIRRSDEPGLARRERWPLYLGGLLTEVAFILGLTLLAYIIAIVAKAVF